MDDTFNSLHQLLQETLNELAIALMVDGAETLTPETLDELAAMADRHDTLRSFADTARSLRSEYDPAKDGWSAAAIHSLQQTLECIAAPSTAGVTVEVSEPGGQDSLEDDPEMLSGFIAEAEEHLTAIEEYVLALEKDPEQMEPVHSVFRGFHTLKGLAGFLGLNRIQSVAHEVETLLDHARNGRLTLTCSHIDVVLESAEYLRGEVAAVQAKVKGRNIDSIDPAGLLDRVRRLLSNANEETNPAAQPIAADPAPAGSVAREGEAFSAAVRQAAGGAFSGSKSAAPASSVRIDTAKLDLLMDVVGEMVIAQSVLAHNPHVMGNRDARLAGGSMQAAGSP